MNPGLQPRARGCGVGFTDNFLEHSMSAQASDIRRRELAQIHVAKTQLGLDDDTYRAMLWTVARVKSAADLDWAGRKKVIDHLKARGFKVRPAKKSGARRLASDAQSRMARGLWIELHQVGAVGDPSEKALGAYVKRMTRVDSLEWLSGTQLQTVIESLKNWRQRLGGEKK